MLKLKIPNSTFFKYLILSITSILLIELLKRNVHFDKLMYYSLSEQLTSKQIAKFLEFQKKWDWLNYIIPPIFILLKNKYNSHYIVYRIIYF